MLIQRLVLKLNDPRLKLVKHLQWSGIEIWALHNPLKVDKNIAHVRYVDYKSTSEIIVSIPELKNFNLVTVDIIWDAENLDNINDNSEDFIILNHVFEHLKNPIRAIWEWYRILKNGWIIFLAVPEKTRTFDKNRARTELAHLIHDYEKPDEQTDFEHYIEFAEVLLRGKVEKWNYTNNEILSEAKRLKEVNYSIHYHVFIEEDVRNIFKWCKENQIADFDIIDSKSLLKNPSDIEFILILRCNKC